MRWERMQTQGILMIFFLWIQIAGDSVRPRGVSDKDLKFYQPLPQNKFKCRNGSAIISYTAVNDDYCDCPDCSDEPGTSACLNGTFYCRNVGHIPVAISSWKVNDGVCDLECCDGSDEWQSSANCTNTCQQAGELHRARVKAEESMRKEGQRQRQKYIKFGKISRVDRERKIKKIEEELKKDLITLEQLKLAKEMAEKADETQREAEKLVDPSCPTKLQECENSSSQKLSNIRRVAQEAYDLYDGLDDECKAKTTLIAAKIREIQQFAGHSVEADAFAPVDHQGDSHDEKEMIEHSNLDSTETTSVESPIPNKVTQPPLSESKGKHDGRTNGPKIHACDDMDASFTNCVIDTITDNIASLGKSMIAPLRWRGWSSFKRSIDRITGKGISESMDFSQLSRDLNKAQDKYNEFERGKKEKERKLEELKKEASTDFGPDGEWESLFGKCFSFDSAEYVYEICILESVTQKQNNGINTNLGHFTRWGGRDSVNTREIQKYSRMMYENGLTCWNGPARSTEVIIQCGAENKVISVSEPSKCEYRMYLSSPAACLDLGSEEDVGRSENNQESLSDDGSEIVGNPQESPVGGHAEL